MFHDDVISGTKTLPQIKYTAQKIMLLEHHSLKEIHNSVTDRSSIVLES